MGALFRGKMLGALERAHARGQLGGRAEFADHAIISSLTAPSSRDDPLKVLHSCRSEDGLRAGLKEGAPV